MMIAGPCTAKGFLWTSKLVSCYDVWLAAKCSNLLLRCSLMMFSRICVLFFGLGAQASSSLRTNTNWLHALPPPGRKDQCVFVNESSHEKKTCKKVANHNNCTLYNTVDSLSLRLNNLSTILSHVFDSDRFGFSVPQHMSAHSLLLVNLTIICHDGRIAWLLSISSMQEQMWILLAWASPLFLSAPAFKQLCGYTRDTSPWKCPGAFWHCDSIPVFFQSLLYFCRLRALRFANPSMEVCRELGSRVKPRVSLSYSASSASNASNLASRHLAPVLTSSLSLLVPLLSTTSTGSTASSVAAQWCSMCRIKVAHRGLAPMTWTWLVLNRSQDDSGQYLRSLPLAFPGLVEESLWFPEVVLSLGDLSKLHWWRGLCGQVSGWIKLRAAFHRLGSVPELRRPPQDGRLDTSFSQSSDRFQQPVNHMHAWGVQCYPPQLMLLWHSWVVRLYVVALRLAGGKRIQASQVKSVLASRPSQRCGPKPWCRRQPSSQKKSKGMGLIIDRPRFW